MGRKSINDLPNEVIQEIFLLLPPLSIPPLQLVCRRFNDLVEPSLWRHHCHTQFRYWNEHHGFPSKFSERSMEVDWKGIFRYRYVVDLSVTRTLNCILASQTDRIEKFNRIMELGYDAKDALLREASVDRDIDDGLARRYYANAAMGCLHRAIAIKEWSKIREGVDVPLERALGAYDLFVMRGKRADINNISMRLDKLAEEIRLEYPQMADLTVREKALAVLQYLRRYNLTGIKDENRYHDLQNNFISLALENEDHPSLPLISTAIYCCVCMRLGVDAQPCGFPFNVVAIVRSPNGLDLDGRSLAPDSVTDPIYLDPFRSDDEVPVKHLKEQLQAMAFPSSEHRRLLDSCSVLEILLRTAQNIMTSVQSAYHEAQIGGGHGPGHFAPSSTFPDLDEAFYAALWVAVLLSVSRGVEEPNAAVVGRQQYVPFIIEHFERRFRADLPLIEQFILPLLQEPAEIAELRDAMREIQIGDTIPKIPKYRQGPKTEGLRFKIGQLFRHTRFNYQAVITGWDVECDAGDTWMAQMRVLELSRGRYQSFYYAMVEDKSTRYVAEENIQVITSEPSEALMELAGQHFKRWDRSSQMFLSNLKDEYPDD